MSKGYRTAQSIQWNELVRAEMSRSLKVQFDLNYGPKIQLKLSLQ